jgi:hypothetical protein
MVDADAGTISVRRYLVSDVDPTADFPELLHDDDDRLVTELVSLPLRTLPPDELTAADTSLDIEPGKVQALS